MTMWFKQRRYGWGWTPITIEGWAITLMFILAAIKYKTNLNIVFALIIGLVVIASLKGPSPRWRWG